MVVTLDFKKKNFGGIVIIRDSVASTSHRANPLHYFWALAHPRKFPKVSPPYPITTHY